MYFMEAHATENRMLWCLATTAGKLCFYAVVKGSMHIYYTAIHVTLIFITTMPASITLSGLIIKCRVAMCDLLVF